MTGPRCSTRCAEWSGKALLAFAQPGVDHLSHDRKHAGTKDRTRGACVPVHNQVSESDQHA